MRVPDARRILTFLSAADGASFCCNKHALQSEEVGSRSKSIVIKGPGGLEILKDQINNSQMVEI